MSFTAQECLKVYTEEQRKRKASSLWSSEMLAALLPIYPCFSAQACYAACYGSEDLSSSREPIADEHIRNRKVPVSGVRTLRSIDFWNGLPESLIPWLIHQG
ncbi:hypothetical protein V6Z88_001129 [Aspergillus fumigatus]